MNVPEIPPIILGGEWNAFNFFKSLAESNRLASREGFFTMEVSGPLGFRSILSEAMSEPNIIAVDDTSEGMTSLVSPSRSMVKSVFLSMKHRPMDTQARAECLSLESELFRQFMTVLTLERTRLGRQLISLNKDIHFQEIDKYFAPGYACAMFQLNVSMPLDLRHRPEEWL